MKLLLDQNLSPKLVSRIADLFPGSLHVQNVALACSSDSEVWEHAKSNRLTIVSKDDDFQSLSVVRGSPPKVIWLQLGNASTAQIEHAIRQRFAEIQLFENDPAAGTLAVR